VKPSSIFERNLATYATAWSAAEYTSDRAHPAEAALVSEFFPSWPARVLDVGSGAGRSSAALARRGYSVVGIDLSEDLLQLARGLYPSIEFHTMDARRLSFDDASFDAVLFSYNGLDVIHPVAGRMACIAEISRVLKPGGTFVMSTHNAIGAVCCGGWFYLSGHIKAVAFLGRQISNRAAFDWYFRYRDGSGDHFLYAAPPARTAAQLEAAGLSILAACGDDGVARPLDRITFRYQHVHFAARKR
jgi:ubiquinone/menaquinone biosynthesis C-methylase UbiE